MSEFWKSTPKYWCKHCNIYVKDTPLERKQHENTGKHQGNLKRFLQGIQKDHLRNEREKDRAKAEVDRLNRVVGSGVSPMPTSSTSQTSRSVASSSSNALSAADQKRQWAQLAEMGIAVPDSARAEMAMAGDWQTVARRLELQLEPEDEKSTDQTLNIGVKKRRLEEDDAELEVEDNTNTIIRKGWGSAVKSYPGQQLEDLSALLAIPLKKAIKSEPIDNSAPMTKTGIKSVKPEADVDSLGSTSTIPDVKSRLLPETLAEEDESANKKSMFKLKTESKNDDARCFDTEDQDVAVPIFKKRKFKATQLKN